VINYNSYFFNKSLALPEYTSEITTPFPFRLLSHSGIVFIKLEISFNSLL